LPACDSDKEKKRGLGTDYSGKDSFLAMTS